MSEEELLELLLAFVPESFQGWCAIVVTVSAFASIILPKPAENAHPLLKGGHRLLCVLGLGATRLRAAGKVAGMFRKKGGN